MSMGDCLAGPHVARCWRVGKWFSYGFLHEVTVGSSHTPPMVGGSENYFRMGFSMR